jgi:hypothetical protein
MCVGVYVASAYEARWRPKNVVTFKDGVVYKVPGTSVPSVLPPLRISGMCSFFLEEKGKISVW